VAELEEALEAERTARAKADKARADVQRELDDVASRLDESRGINVAQVRKRLEKMPKDGRGSETEKK